MGFEKLEKFGPPTRSKNTFQKRKNHTSTTSTSFNCRCTLGTWRVPRFHVWDGWRDPSVSGWWRVMPGKGFDLTLVWGLQIPLQNSFLRIGMNFTLRTKLSSLSCLSCSVDSVLFHISCMLFPCILPVSSFMI